MKIFISLKNIRCISPPKKSSNAVLNSTENWNDSTVWEEHGAWRLKMTYKATI